MLLGVFFMSQLSLHGGSTINLDQHEFYKKVIAIDSSAVIADFSYSTVDVTWLMTTFNEDFKKMTDQQMGAKSQYDCFDGVRLYCSLAQMQSPANIAIGEFWYQPQWQKAKYALVIVYTKDGFHFIDPRKGSEVKLSVNELKTCSFLRM
jgi:hypothetical protein